MSLDVNYINEVLIQKGITHEEGLSDEEFEKIENFYSIKFPIALEVAILIAIVFFPLFI